MSIRKSEALKNPKVLFVAAEAVPLAKAGGLGDVAGELPAVIQSMGADIRVVIPAYLGIEAQTDIIGDFPVAMGAKNETCIVRSVRGAKVPTFLADNYNYFGRPGIYGHADDSERFAFFCLAVYQMLLRFDFKPDIIHLNDWHTAPLAMLVRENDKEHPQLSSVSILYTIHNMAYQGVCDRRVFSLFGLKDVVFQMDKVEYYGCFNPMKAGLNYADWINTVSPRYARQILKAEESFGLEGVLEKRKDRLSGIINGIDSVFWSPETDPLLYAPYTSEALEGKKNNKAALKEELGLTPGDKPLFGMVTRLVNHKGLDILESGIEAILKEGGQFVLLGNGEKYYEYALRRLEERNPGSVAIILEFNTEKAHRIYAACDMFLMPSKTEPCGIAQLIAMTYGAVPVVHKTGGLADTVEDYGQDPDRGTGFVFSTYTSEAFIRAIRRSLRLYEKNRAGWEALIKRAMARDSSWKASAAEYLSLYRKLIKNQGKREELTAPLKISK